MPPDPRVHVGVLAIVRNPSGMILVGKRVGTGPVASDGRGSWSPPGGWIDYDETPEAAAIREVREETGIIVADPQPLGWNQRVNDDGSLSIICLCMTARWISGTPTVTEPDKFVDLLWCSVDVLKGMDLFPPLGDLIANGVLT